MVASRDASVQAGMNIFRRSDPLAENPAGFDFKRARFWHISKRSARLSPLRSGAVVPFH
jgi:hypothetical protein